MANELKIEYLPVGSLKPYERNARKHADADVQTIVASIREFGFDDPIGVWGKDNLIVEGHGRLIAAKQLGMETVPVIHLDHLTDEQRRAYALAHNKTAEMSEWDFDLLGGELDDIFDIDMEQFGFQLGTDDEEEAEDGEEENPTDVLPDSRVLIASISVFGTKSECFVDVRIDSENAEQLAEKIREISPEVVGERIREVLSGL